MRVTGISGAISHLDNYEPKAMQELLLPSL